MKTIVIKMQSINALNEAILNDIAEDELEEDMEIATQFEIKISKETDKFTEFLLKYKEVNVTVKRSVAESSTISGVKFDATMTKK